ncbi:hypothetical protein HanIR_Chr17g0872731 [Helianthus annuus]|nr:hypothetical protein HanIR_Chr17g0872731 [Helianthus annuus]
MNYKLKNKTQTHTQEYVCVCEDRPGRALGSSNPNFNKSIKLKVKSGPNRMHEHILMITKSWGSQV